MKKHLYLYLFIFASLIALVFYINGRKYQEKLESQVALLRKNEEKKDKEIKELELKVIESQDLSFSLDKNAEAENYLYESNLSVEEVKQSVTDKLFELNLQDGGNPLIPYIGEGRGFQISSLRFVNHKWVLVSCYDGDQWGEALIEYNFDSEKSVELETIKALLYLN